MRSRLSIAIVLVYGALIVMLAVRAALVGLDTRDVMLAVVSVVAVGGELMGAEGMARWARVAMLVAGVLLLALLAARQAGLF